MGVRRLDDWLPVEDEAGFGRFAPTRWQGVILALGRVVRFRGFLRKRLAMLVHWLRPSPIDVSLAGLRFRLYLTNNACERRFAMEQSRYDGHEIGAIADVLARHKNPLFVDIGANIGLFSLLVAKAVPNAKILAIEPNPNLYRRLCFNLSLNRPHSIKPLACGVGEKQGKARLHFTNNNAGQATLAQTHEDKGGISVAIYPLHELIAQNAAKTPFVALKLDVEGYEDRIIIPFLEHVPDTGLPAIIVMEHRWRERWQRNALEICAQRGYDEVSRDKDNLILIRKDS